MVVGGVCLQLAGRALVVVGWRQWQEEGEEEARGAGPACAPPGPPTGRHAEVAQLGPALYPPDSQVSWADTVGAELVFISSDTCTCCESENLDSCARLQNDV